LLELSLGAEVLLMPIVLYEILLEFAEIHVHSSSLERVLSSLGDAVTEAAGNIEHARRHYHEDHCDSVCDEESDVLESLVGTAFVVAQAQITGVVSSVMRLHKKAQSDGVHVAGLKGERREIMRLKSPVLAGTSYSRIQVIDAFANYFKHHDEWKVPWANLESRSKPTADIIAAAGAKEGSTGNLRAGLKALDIDYDLLDRLHDEIATWASDVVKTYRSELHAKGLV